MSFLDETGYRHLYQKIVNKVQALWQKVGTATLTTNAQNTSEAVNELKQSLVKYTEKEITTSAYGTVNLGMAFPTYKVLAVTVTDNSDAAAFIIVVNNNHWAVLYNVTNMTKLISTTLNVRIYYYQ